MNLAVPTVFPSPLARANPLTKLAAGVVVGITSFVAGDAMTSGIVIAVTLTAVPWSGLGPRDLLLRMWPLAVIVGFGIVVNVLFAQEHPGHTLLTAGPLVISTGSLVAALTIALRVVAVVAPATLALATTDPTDLADALVQQLHASARFSYGALAALRLMPLLFDEWSTITLARRARGVDSRGNPLIAVRLFARTAFILLVGAMRRAIRLAHAMDARGFDSRGSRSVARPQSVRYSDIALLACAIAVAVAVTTLSVLLGTWSPPLA